MGSMIPVLFAALIVLYPVFSIVLFIFLQRKKYLKSLHHYLMSTFGLPAVVVFLMWLWALMNFDGRCGGWLGETYPCRLPQYMMEQLVWAVFAFAVPIMFSVVTNTIVFLWIIWKDRRAKKLEHGGQIIA